MKFGLITNLKRIGAYEAIAAAVAWARDRGQELCLSDDLKESVPGLTNYAPVQQVAQDSDVLISMGGDGTLLAAARAVGPSQTLLLGINLGSLGFLTQQTPQQLVEALDAVVAGEYHVEDRMLLKAQVKHGVQPEPGWALNDVVIDNGPVSRVLRIALRVNGEDVVTYIADGLIIATPTGSTAYALAVGGPIVKPDMNAMIAAPIAPFSLTTRPMIFAGEDELEVQIATEGRPAILTLDGQINVELENSQTVKISRADHTARLIIFKESSYYQLLRSKLNWGITPNF